VEVVGEMDDPAHLIHISLYFLAWLEVPPRRDEVCVVAFL
jgi:hypothetical protein